MAFSINITTSLPDVISKLKGNLDILRNPEYLFRGVCFDLIDLMTFRIHEQGIATDGTQIGTYSAPYLKERQKKYNRTADTKMIVSLTRQLENDWSVIATPGGYGIGFKNVFNFNKSQWVEKIKDKPIFSLSSSEEQYAFDAITDKINDALNGKGSS